MFKKRFSITQDNFVYELTCKNEDAMEYVIKTYGKLYKSIICKYFKKSTYIEECLDDVFMSIWNNIEMFEPHKNTFVNWSCAIARYKSIDLLRKLKIDDTKLELYKDFNNMNIVSKDNYSFDNELDEKIERVLEELKEEDKIILLSAYAEQKTNEEIASELNVDVSNVYNRLSRARKKFKVIYGGKDEKCI